MTNKELQERIIYQDFYYVVANKPGGMSAQDDYSEGTSFHKHLEQFCNKQLHVVHRLDRPTSGVIIYAKKKSAAAYVSRLLKNGNDQFAKKYLAVVKNPPVEESGELRHYLFHEKKQRKGLVVDANKKGAKEASLSYKTLAKIDNYTLLEISLNTGRFHQIRAQLGAIGSPIKGDVKYGARRGNKDRSINLHALTIDLPFKEDGQGLTLQASVPDEPVWNAFKEIRSEIGQNKHKQWTEEQT